MLSIHELEFSEAGRRLGYDMFRYRRTRCSRPWLHRPLRPERLSASICEGMAHAAAKGVWPEPTDRFVRKWLQLRLSAHQRGRAFDDAVTPGLIRAIDVAICPVLRLTLTHGEQKDTDWSVDRLNNDGAYAANNLAVMSRRANQAKGSRSFEEVLALADGSSRNDGLLPIEWLRLASLMLGPCFASRPQAAPCIPLAAPIPLHSVRLAMQQIQHVFTTQAGTQSGKNRLIKHFRQGSHGDRSETHLRLLAESVHQGLKGLGHAHDVWLGDRPMAALHRWREALTLAEWTLASAISGHLANSRPVALATLASWRLSSKGYVGGLNHSVRAEAPTPKGSSASKAHVSA